MGQDDRCGICGKHYQSCKHYTKYHVKIQPHIGPSKTFCGRQAHGCIIAESLESYDNDDIDPDDFCRRCVKKIGRPPGTVADENLDFEILCDGE